MPTLRTANADRPPLPAIKGLYEPKPGFSAPLRIFPFPPPVGCGKVPQSSDAPARRVPCVPGESQSAQQVNGRAARVSCRAYHASLGLCRRSAPRGGRPHATFKNNLGRARADGRRCGIRKPLRTHPAARAPSGPSEGVWAGQRIAYDQSLHRPTRTLDRGVAEEGIISRHTRLRTSMLQRRHCSSVGPGLQTRRIRGIGGSDDPPYAQPCLHSLICQTKGDKQQ